MQSAFSRADSNADGMLTKEEYVGFFRKPLEKMKSIAPDRACHAVLAAAAGLRAGRAWGSCVQTGC